MKRKNPKELNSARAKLYFMFLQGEDYTIAKFKKWKPDPSSAAKLSFWDLWYEPNIGKKTITEIIRWLGEHDLELAETPLDYKKMRK